jgi:very-short-patch-repair endonuclease
VRANALRQSSTDAERAIWLAMRDRRLAGYKFRRQHPLGPFFVDFVCIDAKLVVEIDGSQHFDAANAEADRTRTRKLQQLGFTVLRFDNRQVLTERAAVLETIHQWLLSHHPHPNPLPHPKAKPSASHAGEGASHQETST